MKGVVSLENKERPVQPTSKAGSTAKKQSSLSMIAVTRQWQKSQAGDDGVLSGGYTMCFYCGKVDLSDLTLLAIDGKMIAYHKDKENNNRMPAHLGASCPKCYLENQPKGGRSRKARKRDDCNNLL